MKIDEFELTLQGKSAAVLAFKAQVERACQVLEGPIVIEGARGNYTDEIARGIHACSEVKTKKILYLRAESLKLDTEITLGDGPALAKDLHQIRPEILRQLFETVEIAQKKHKWPYRFFVCSQVKLKWFVSLGHLSEEQYHFLTQTMVHVPNLRDRSEDIPLLAQRILESACKGLQRSLLTFSSRAMDELISYSWPGNLAELQDAVQTLCFRARHSKINQSDVEKVLPPVLRKVPVEELTLEEVLLEKLQGFLHHLDGSQADDVYEEFLARVEPPLLQAILQRTGGNQIKAAKLLGINRNTLRKKLTQYEIAT